MKKAKIYDNPKTKCRELWIGPTLYTVVNIHNRNPNERLPKGDSLIADLIRIGPWDAGTTYFKEVVSELV